MYSHSFSLLFHFKWFTQVFFFLSVGILDCNIQKTPGNFHPEREYVGRVTGTHRAKKRLEIQSENRNGPHGAPEIERRQLICCCWEDDLQSPVRPHVLHFRLIVIGGCIWLNLRHVPAAADSGAVQRAQGLSGFLWRDGHLFTPSLQSVEFLRDMRGA